MWSYDIIELFSIIYFIFSKFVELNESEFKPNLNGIKLKVF